MKRSNHQFDPKRLTKSSAAGRPLAWSILLCACAIAVGTTSLRADDDLPLPPEYQVFQRAMETVNSADRLTVEDKTKLREQHDKIQAQFRKVWASLSAVYVDCKSTLAENTAHGQAHNERREVLEQQKASVDLTDEGAVAAFNQRVDAYNAEKTQLEQERKDIMKKWTQQAEKTQAWIDSSGMKAFVDAVHSKLLFYYGPAYHQLLGIHDGTLDWDGRKR
jgi:hypothetical protein